MNQTQIPTEVYQAQIKANAVVSAQVRISVSLPWNDPQKDALAIERHKLDMIRVQIQEEPTLAVAAALVAETEALWNYLKAMN